MLFVVLLMALPPLLLFVEFTRTQELCGVAADVTIPMLHFYDLPFVVGLPLLLAVVVNT